jgi:hypothetical protein
MQQFFPSEQNSQSKLLAVYNVRNSSGERANLQVFNLNMAGILCSPLYCLASNILGVASKFLLASSTLGSAAVQASVWQSGLDYKRNGVNV